MKYHFNKLLEIEKIHDWKWLQFRFEDAGLTSSETYGK